MKLKLITPLTVLSVLTLILAFGSIVYLAFAGDSMFRTQCPQCGKPVFTQALSVTVTNEPVLNGVKVRKQVRLKCPACGNEFDAVSEKIKQTVSAEEVTLTLHPQQLPVPAPITWQPVPTNHIYIVAPAGRALVLLHASNLSLQQIVDCYQTNRNNLSLVLLTNAL